MALAWLVIGERARAVRVVAALVGLAGVALLVLRSPDGVTALGLAGAFGSVLVSALGFVLVKRWPAPVDMLTLMSWQLVVGGLLLLPVAFLVEGAPPAIDGRAAVGYAWLAIVGTGLAYFCWFRGLTRMPAGGRLADRAASTRSSAPCSASRSPREAFGWTQALGMLLVLGGVLAGQPAVVALVRRRTRETGASTPLDRPVARAGRRRQPTVTRPRWTPWPCRCRPRGTCSRRGGWS